MTEYHLYSKGDLVSFIERDGEVSYGIVTDTFNSQIGLGYSIGVLREGSFSDIDSYCSRYQKELLDATLDEIMVNIMMKT